MANDSKKYNSVAANEALAIGYGNSQYLHYLDRYCEELIASGEDPDAMTKPLNQIMKSIDDFQSTVIQQIPD